MSSTTSVVVENDRGRNILFAHLIWGKVSPQKWGEIKKILYERFGLNVVSESSPRSFTSAALQLEIDDNTVIIEQKFVPVM